jgi:uncharacterized tellurite resistance protein B-like protein
MLNALRDMFRKVSTGEEKPHFDADDERLALAALMIHCMSIDGAISGAERDKLRSVLSGSFGLDGADLDLLIADAQRPSRRRRPLSLHQRAEAQHERRSAHPRRGKPLGNGFRRW